MKKDYALIATIIFVLGFASGACLCNYTQEKLGLNTVVSSTPEVIATATFYCDNDKAIIAEFRKNSVYIKLSDGRALVLLQTISGSGARYANTDESFVFWNKGDTAFIQEGENYTYQNCATK